MFSPCSAVKETTVVPEWSCESLLWEPFLRRLTMCLCSAINSDETGGRNFNAFQSVAKTLNGTAVSQTAPSGTPENGAVSTRSGFALGFGAVAALLISSL